MANETEIALREDLNKLAGQQPAMIKIVDQASYDRVALMLVKVIQPFRKRWAEYWKEPIGTAHAAHKAVLAKFKEGDERAGLLETAAKLEIRKWDDAQEAIRQERQRARQRAEEEREARERAAQAAFAEEEGAPPAEIEAIVSAPSIAVAEPVPETYAKIKGISRRPHWVAEVRNLKALCAAIAKGTVPVNYVLPNQQVLNSRANADRETMQVPGVIAKNDSKIGR